MIAYTYKSHNKFTLTDKPKPEILSSRDAIVRVTMSSICSSDLHIKHGSVPRAVPGITVGHEMVGIVASVGSDVTKFKPGDRVVSDNGFVCRVCPACQRGDFENCENNRSVGTINCWDGAYADYFVVPEMHLYHLPDEISYKKGAMIEPLTVAYGGMTKYPITSETVVAVIGTGPIGMSAIALAKQMGAKKVICIGRTEVKLDVAKKLGATDIINIRKENDIERINEITNGKGADFVVETTGAPTTLQQAIDIVKKRGFIALIGFYETEVNDLIINRLVTKEATMRGIMGEMGIIPPIIKYITESGLDLEPMITREIEFDDVVNYFENHREMHKSDIKVLVKVNDEN